MRTLVRQARDAWQSGGVRDIAKGGLTGIVASVMNRLLTIGSAIILARLLGSDGYGIYATAIAAMMILAVLAEFGMYSLLIREVSAAHARGAWSELMGFGASAVRFTLVVAAIVGAIGVAVLWLTPLIADPVERVALTLMLALLPVSTLYRLFNAMLYGLRKIAWAQITEQFVLPAAAFALFLAMSLTAVEWRPQDALLAQIAAGLASMAIAGFLIHRALAPARALDARLTPARGFQRRALPFLLIGAAGTITQQIDTVIVSAMMGNSETALYRVASQAATLTWFGIQILQSIAAPFFARLYHSGDIAALRKLFRWTTALAIASAAPVLLLFIVFGRPLIELTFGPEYVGAQPLMIVLSAGYLVNVICGPVGSLLAMTGEESWASRAYLVTSILAVLIAVTLVRPFGPMGVAFGTAFGVASYHLVLRIHTRRRLGF
jgi:O-antigen/teichoic acid export membrane protein